MKLIRIEDSEDNGGNGNGGESDEMDGRGESDENEDEENESEDENDEYEGNWDKDNKADWLNDRNEDGKLKVMRQWRRWEEADWLWLDDDGVLDFFFFYLISMRQRAFLGMSRVLGWQRDLRKRR